MLGVSLNIFTLAIRRYFGGGGGQFAGSSLNLDMTSGNRTLDPRITFSRASNATVTGPDGTLQYAPHNLLTFSEQFDNAAWGKSSAPVTANAATAPNGEATADRISDTVDAGNTVHSITQSLAWSAGTPYTLSIHGKVGTLPGLHLLLPSAAFGVDTRANFDLVNGTSEVIAGTAVAAITVDAQGYFRCSIRATATTAATAGFQIRTMKLVGGVLSSFYQGDGTGTVLYWGAQLNIGSLQPYYPTTVKNLLGFTQEFDNPAWTKTNSTVTANTSAAPDGSLTADTLTATSTSFARVQQNVVVGAGTDTLSVYAKAGTSSFLAGTVEVSGQVLRLYANLSTGATSQVTDLGTISATSSAVNVGGGWWRFRWTIAIPTSATYALYFAVTDAFGSFSVTVGRTIELWGAQLSDSASLDPYVYNPGAAPTSQAYYGPRFDYDPATLSPRGLLIEEQRTNLLLQSQSFDDVYWTKARAFVTANTAVSPDGTQNAEALIEDSTTSNTHFAFSSSVAVATGTVYTYTIYAKASGRSWFNMQIGTGTEAYGALVPFCFFNVSNGTVGTSANATGSIASVGNGWFRCTLVAIATTAATTTNIRIKLADSGSTDSYTGNGTSGIFIWGAQLEAGSFATSYIPTTTAAATRAADVATMTGANFNNWYRQDEGTLFSEFSVFGVGSASNFNGVAVVDDGTVNNAMELAMWDAAADSLRWGGYVGGTTQWSISPKNYSTPLVTKGAGAYRANSFNGAFDGVLGAEDTAGSVPVVSTLRLGANRGGSGNYLNGHIRRIAFYPRRLTNAELQGITQ